MSTVIKYCGVFGSFAFVAKLSSRNRRIARPRFELDDATSSRTRHEITIKNY